MEKYQCRLPIDLEPIFQGAICDQYILASVPCVPTHVSIPCTAVGGAGGADHDLSDACNLCSHASVAAMMAVTQTCLPPCPSGLQARDTLLEVGGPLPRVGLRSPEATVEGYARAGEIIVEVWRVPSRVWSLHRGEKSWYP